MEILHTPWRRAYVVNARDQEGCIFCRLFADGRDDAARFILHRTPDACLMLNIYPYLPGHLLAVPHRHGASPGEFPGGELPGLLELCRHGERLLRRSYGCHAVYAGANLGQAAGAGVPDHLHFHIVPRPAGPPWEACRAGKEPAESLLMTYRRLMATQATL